MRRPKFVTTFLRNEEDKERVEGDPADEIHPTKNGSPASPEGHHAESRTPFVRIEDDKARVEGEPTDEKDPLGKKRRP